MDITNILKRIIPIEALKLGHLIIIMQDRNKEFFSLFAAIFVTGKVFPPAFIY